MAITFGGATGWNGASESLRSLRTKEKAAPKTINAAPPPPKKPTPSTIDRYGVGQFTPTREGWAGGFFRNLIGSLANQFQQGYAPVLAGQASNLEPSARVNPVSINPQVANTIGEGIRTYGQVVTQANQPYRALPYIQDVLTEASKKYWPTSDPNSAYMDSAQWLKDKNAGLSAPTEQTWFQGAQDWAADAVNSITGNATMATKPSTAPTTTQALPEGFQQYDKGYVEQQPWYLGGDIGVYGQGVQPTEWTDPETGRKYRVEVSSRGFGWYPVGFGQLDAPAPPDDGGGYDWWNYSGFGGGGGGGGYYSAPSTYSNSNWIDRILTNWRINRK